MPERREPSLNDGAPPRPLRDSLPHLGGDQRRNTVVAFGIAVAALLALLVWRPWAGGPETQPTAGEAEGAEPAEAAGLLPPPMAEAEAEAEGGEPEEAPLLQMDEVVEEAGEPAEVAAVEPGPFWGHLDRALDAGDRIDEARVRSWLAADGPDVAAAAAARRAQLKAVDAALAALIPAEASGLEATDQAALDRIFAAAPGEAADQLKSWIEREHGKRGDATFEVASGWLRANRTPKAFEVLVQLTQRKLGPKTKAWLSETAPRDLMGQ